ncbi:MAG: 30S ribosomal protein S3ae [Thermoplasmata archaeon]|nr:30S ribosomal protein S3ae [Thermoplasmata archaeon]
MAEKKGRTAARQVRDRWKMKNWYNIQAPEMFERASLGETLSDENGKIMGRKTIVSFQDLTGDYAKAHIKITFEVYAVKGNDAITRFVGHDFRKDYVIRMARRRRTKIDGVIDVTTKDGYKIRVKPLAIAEKRIKTTQAKGIRHAIADAVIESANAMTFSEFVKSMLSGEMADLATKRCKPIFPLRKVEIKKSQVLSFPEVAERITDEVEPAAETAEAAEVASAEGITPEAPTPEQIGSREEVLEILTGLKGIGPMKAEALYEAGFHSLEALKEATTEQIAAVEGFSPSLAKKVQEQL